MKRERSGSGGKVKRHDNNRVAPVRVQLTVLPNLEAVRCQGDFSNSKAALLACGFPESDYDDVFGVLMSLGAFGDCEVLYNVAEANRLKSRY
jgi:hypothetical protein